MKILDSDVCIEILRGNIEVIEKRRTVDDDVATTWITASELAYGARKSRDPDHNTTLVTEFLATLPVVGPDLAAALEFGRQKAKLEREGMRIADADLLIGAIALARGASVVTGNRKHCERIESLRTENWIRDRRGSGVPPGRDGAPWTPRAPRIFGVEPDFQSGFEDQGYEAATGMARRGSREVG